MRTPILDHGYVELLDSMGDDLSIVNGARTSFDAASVLHQPACKAVNRDGNPPCSCDDFKRAAESAGYSDHHHPAPTDLAKKDAGLINFLMRERHGTPFELVQFKFAVKAPIFVTREWMRHRVGSFNEMSGRYVELPREFYVPARDQIREQKGKPGAYYYERVDEDGRAEANMDLIEATANYAFDRYEDVLADGIAKEVARLVLPVNTYTKFVWSINLRALMNFLSLRNHDHAQWEIRQYAQEIEKMASRVAPVAMAAFVEHGRKQP